MFTYALDILVIGIAMTVTPKELCAEICPFLATAGVVGIAAAFGAQRLVQNLMREFFILPEDQILVGGVVEMGGKSGTAERVYCRMTVLRDLSGNVFLIRALLKGSGT